MNYVRPPTISLKLLIFFYFYFQGYNTTDSITTEPNSLTSENQNSINSNQTSPNIPIVPNNNNISNNNNNTNNNNTRYPTLPKSQNPLYGQTPTYPTTYDTTIRRSPEGKDNDSFVPEDKLTTNNNGLQKNGDISTGIFSTKNENGKINVQVTVLVGKYI